MRAAPALLVVSLLAPLALLPSARAEIYRWTDERGTTHYVDDLAQVPEARRPGAKVFRSRVPVEAAPEADASAPTQGGFAGALARDLGLLKQPTQDPISVLQVVGVYPARGWYPAAVLGPSVVEEVVAATRAAASAKRLPQSVAGAEAAVLRVAESLGVPGPPPTVVAEPAPPPAPPAPIVIAPHIVVEAPAPAVVVQQAAPHPDAYVRAYGPAFAWGVPFAPAPQRLSPRKARARPDRTPPLANPAGSISRSPIEPLRSLPFTRSPGF
jgi:hypothetical protein